MMHITRQHLDQVAKSMFEELAASPTANGMALRRVDPYTLLLFHRDGSLRLHVGHPNRWPTLEETLPLALAFGVPLEDQEPTAETYRLAYRLASPGLTLKTMRYSWRQDLIAARPARPRQLTIFGPAELGTATGGHDALSAGL